LLSHFEGELSKCRHFLVFKDAPDEKMAFKEAGATHVPKGHLFQATR
jgi:hypothetical protein